MTKTIKRSLMGIAVVMAFIGLAPQAKADDGYCREYTRTVNIGGRSQDAYGTACLQPDGSWMIVGEGLGNDIPDDVSDVRYVINDNNRYITPPRVVYYSEPQYRVYRSRPIIPIFSWSSNGIYRGGHYVPYRRTNWGNGHDNGNHGRGPDWNDHRGDGHGRRH